MQFILVAVAPIKLILIIQLFNLLNDDIHKGINRIIPYPPSFRRIAAKIIEPSKGASTWAFGSHKCTKNIGIFTKNAIIKGIESRDFDKIIADKGKEMFLMKKMIVIKRGSEAVTV